MLQPRAGLAGSADEAGAAQAVPAVPAQPSAQLARPTQTDPAAGPRHVPVRAAAGSHDCPVAPDQAGGRAGAGWQGRRQQRHHQNAAQSGADGGHLTRSQDTGALQPTRHHLYTHWTGSGPQC